MGSLPKWVLTPQKETSSRVLKMTIFKKVFEAFMRHKNRSNACQKTESFFELFINKILNLLLWLLNMNRLYLGKLQYWNNVIYVDLRPQAHCFSIHLGITTKQVKTSQIVPCIWDFGDNIYLFLTIKVLKSELGDFSNFCGLLRIIEPYIIAVKLRYISILDM